MAQGRVDVHAHFLPPGFPALGSPKEYFKSPPIPGWSPEDTIEFMDRNGIATQMLSLGIGHSIPAARAVNDYGAEMVRRFPDRFGLLATLPMVDVDAAVAEIDYAFDEIKADGIALSTSYDGVYLGNPKFEPVFASLDRRKATVFIHPTMPVGFDCFACGRPGPLIEVALESCRGATDMLYAGIFRRFTGIKFILAHGGGALPTLVNRIAQVGTCSWMEHPVEMTQETVREDFATLYVDTALAGGAASILPVLEMTSADHIVFGTDYPPATEPVIRQNIQQIADLTCLTEQQKEAIGQNARALFARFQTADVVAA